MLKINCNLEELKGKSNKVIASALKKELKLQLKGIKFSVTSSIYSIDCSCSPEEFENNKEVIKEVAGMFAKYTVDKIYINNQIAYYSNTQEYQEQQKREYEENQKQLEIKRQQRENLYNSNVTVSEIKNAKIKNVEDKNIFVLAAEPGVNKNDWKVDNDRYIEEHSYINKYKITHIIELNQKEYNYFSFNLLENYDFLKGKGGNHVDKNGQFDYGYAVAIVCPGEETLIIDPQGFSYARYTCKLVEDINNDLEKEINSKIKIENQFYNEELKNIVDNELYVYTKDMWSYMLDCIKNDIRFIYNGYDRKTYVTGYALKELIKEGNRVALPVEKSKIKIESIVKNLLNIQEGISFTLSPSEEEKELLKINFLTRLKQEFKRTPKNPDPTKPTKKKNENLNKELKEETKNQNPKVLELQNYRPLNNATLEGNATKKQLYALYCITKIKTTNLKISKQQASDLIKESKKGINIKEKLENLIYGNSKII